MVKQSEITCHYCGCKSNKPAKEVRRQLKKDAEHKFYCNQTCYNAYRQENYSNKWSASHSRARYSLLKALHNPALAHCADCGTVHYVKNMDCHHKDGDYLNNSLDNLTLVCKDCHPLADVLMRAERVRQEEKNYVIF